MGVLGQGVQQTPRTTMQRRKFLLGMGSLAAGGAAATGTGALSVVSVDRDIVASVTGDESAYLAMVPDSQYASINGGKLSLSFDKLNRNANTSFRNVFYFQNNGENDLRVQLTDGGSGVSFPNNSPMVVSYSMSRDEGTAYTNLNVFPNSPNWIGDKSWGHSGPNSADADTGFLDLTPGQTAAIHFDFFLKSDDDSSEVNSEVTGELGNPQNIGSVPSEIGFYASAVPESGAL